MSSYTRLTSVDLMLKQGNLESIGKINIKSITRNRKMNFYDLTTSIILKKAQTLTLELNEFTEKMRKPNITKQAYSKQRQNLNPEVFKYINEEYIKKIYNEIPLEICKGYIVLSVDGSGIELPNCDVLKKYYGVTESQKGSVGRVRAKALGIYDSLNKIMIKTTIDPYKKSEKDQFLDLLEELNEEESKELYFTRWNMEKSFDIIKNKINIENFSTKTVIGI